MTDLPSAPSIPSRLGVLLTETRPEALAARLVTGPGTTHHGRVRASAVVYLADVVAGLSVDTDPDVWSFTSDLSLRLPDRSSPDIVDARPTVLRAGARSSTLEVHLAADGRRFGRSIVGFAHVPRRPGDHDKPKLDLEGWVEAWAAIPVLDQPMRQAAGIESTDRRRGEVSVALDPALLNPAGTLQGAMVALVAECSAEDFTSCHADAPRVVTDLDIRFLGQARRGPVRAWTEAVDDATDGSVLVTLLDVGAGDRLVAQVLARAVDPSLSR